MFKITPINMIMAPNFYSLAANGAWLISDPNQQNLWFRLDIIDDLGQRPYIPSAGSALDAVFFRRDTYSVSNQINSYSRVERTENNITKSATFNGLNGSIGYFSITSADAEDILSGSVKFVFTESTIETAWNQNWIIKKQISMQGH